MLRLWPEQVTLGVFPNACWLQRGRQTEIAATDVVRPAADAALFDVVDTLLAQRGALFRRGASVDVLVSDAVGATMALPWQDSLGSTTLVRAYARMLLESEGRLDNAAWTVDGGFRHFGGSGLGVALPDDWITQLQQVLGKHGLRLRSALPVSAAAYWQFDRMHRRHQNVLLLDEGSRVTALLYRAKRLYALDVQPLLNDAGENAERLCRRLRALYGEVFDIWIWSLGDGTALAKMVARCLPNAKVNSLALGHWRRN
ncbi:hypothetical protein GTP45_12730 [Pseudoduganella sp. FT55W]|uniref:Uncharacterized protein n=1 Tax=Duganella rivi TaxID=2666083 RepID=A0A7X4GS87_9BURK|nr:hypothetical protein [Duganella rivi]MYM67694.1 hypothetical protein [Duganella rivi]